VKSVHIKNKYACHLCGFKAKKHQRIIDLNGFYKEGDKMSNFVTVCPLCEVPNRLSKFGNREIGGLVYIPELTQSEINHIYHIYWGTLNFPEMTEKHQKEFDDKDGTFADLLDSFITMIEKRNKTAIQMYGDGINDFVTVANIMFNLPKKNYTNRDKIFRHLRFIPNKDFFKKEREYYDAAIYPNFTQSNRSAFKAKLVKDYE
jgi:hypothetical protein